MKTIGTDRVACCAAIRLRVKARKMASRCEDQIGCRPAAVRTLVSPSELDVEILAVDVAGDEGLAESGDVGLGVTNWP